MFTRGLVLNQNLKIWRLQDMKNKIDFIITVLNRTDYVELLVNSINRFVKYPHNIIMITDVSTEEEVKTYEKLVDIFGKEENIKIVKSSVKDKTDGYTVKCKIDGRMVGTNSLYKSIALTEGIKEGDSEYICLLDYDTIFLDEWVDEILKRLEEEELFFISHSWHKCGVARDQFLIYRRDEFEKHNLYPNCDYIDSTGNFTHFAKENNLKYEILSNTFNNPELRNEHVINLSYGEQAFTPKTNKPFFYHYGRGSMRDDNLYRVWNNAWTDYFKQQDSNEKSNWWTTE